MTSRTHRPYSERTTSELTYIHAALEQRGSPVPVDLIAALTDRGIILND